jgi:hypothetical protein
MALERLTVLAQAHLEWLSVPRLLILLGGVSLISMIIGTCLMFEVSGPLPPPRDPPPPPEKMAISEYRYKEGFFRSLAEEDAAKVHLGKDVLGSLRMSNPYFAEFSGYQRLKIGGALETSHLKLQALSENLWVGDEGQGYRTFHVVLKIKNKTDKYLAYRITTTISGRCNGKGIVQHNALALRPNEEIQRTECLHNGAGSLVVKQVDLMEISPLGYYYISRLDPLRLQFDQRSSEGHFIDGGFPPCKLLPWHIIEAALKRGEATWYDILDFYSRHNCDEYTFFIGYHHLNQGPEHLPIRPPSAQL